MVKLIVVFATIIATTFPPVPADAQQPGATRYNTVVLPAHGAGATAQHPLPRRWGAVVVGRRDALGWAVDMESEQAAKAAALDDCVSTGGQACKVEYVFFNACGAVATGPTRNGWASSDPLDRSLRLVKEDALEQCGKECSIVHEGCAVPGGR